MRRWKRYKSEKDFCLGLYSWRPPKKKIIAHWKKQFTIFESSLRGGGVKIYKKAKLAY